jgi:hypothetical protein
MPRFVRLPIAFAILAFCASPVRADGVFAMSWDDCTGPLTRALAPGSVAALHASVVGQSEPHKGYRIRLMIATRCPGAIEDPLIPPDAWRFDAGGCQGPKRLTVDPLPSPAIAKACPPFSETATPVAITTVEYGPATNSSVEVTLSVSYAEGVYPVDPGQRLHLARFEFDQSIGVFGATVPGTCGGLEVPMCVTVTELAWLAWDFTPVPWEVGVRSLTISQHTPARASTWGNLKNLYR